MVSNRKSCKVATIANLQIKYFCFFLEDFSSYIFRTARYTAGSDLSIAYIIIESWMDSKAAFPLASE